MSEVEELESRVRSLPAEDFATFREWFVEYENSIWDQQIANDYRSPRSSMDLDWKSRRL
ncbi:hypothetical protein MTBBW1_1670077 [Desulfamplus magnetovallimortis]|uniref:Uncharacterized protein n=1 Tax=Desulfamplus magnetovallimortis TaxID=1246637 RepID=A0A1W1H9B3_9BACT|nr:hypothetical protein MTBBW1_1670077 [Desulfamplus magnetovallimortis]